MIKIPLLFPLSLSTPSAAIGTLRITQNGDLSKSPSALATANPPCNDRSEIGGYVFKRVESRSERRRDGEGEADRVESRNRNRLTETVQDSRRLGERGTSDVLSSARTAFRAGFASRLRLATVESHWRTHVRARISNRGTIGTVARRRPVLGGSSCEGSLAGGRAIGKSRG